MTNRLLITGVDAAGRVVRTGRLSVPTIATAPP
jgi:hypothetical protein